MAEIHPNILKINPGSIKIENFIPGRVYKDSLKLTNISKSPIVFTIKASDKRKLTLNKTFLRIEVNTLFAHLFLFVSINIVESSFILLNELMKLKLLI